MGALAMQQPAVEDRKLVEETLGGSPLAFQLLMERYQRRIFALARHYTRNAAEVEDLVQDTFLKAYTRLEQFQHQSSFYTWLYRIGVNTCLDFHKRRGRNPVQAVEDPELAAEASESSLGRQVASPSATLEAAEVAEITREVLEEMPEIFRTVIILREFEDLAYQDIADALGISIGTVESRLFRARARFKDKLLQKYPEFGQD
ncbi:MAG: RNA polymerase sigma factor RpoE [Planctomycetes bacterium]|nr:RNA polymerase sigma factor RpoE [Planctomycetota bacterium]